MEVARNMDSVFAGAAESDTDFDVFFDQEDSLIDTVNGVNEAGDPLTGVDFEDLHQTQDDATAKEVRDGEADDNSMGAPNPEGTKPDGLKEAGDPLTGVGFEDLHQTQDNASVKDVKDGEAGDNPMGSKQAEGTKPADVDDGSVKGEVGKESDADKFHGDAEQNYQQDKEKNPTPDPDDLNGSIEKVAEGGDLDDVLLGDDDDDDLTEGCKKESCEGSKDNKDSEPAKDESCKEGKEETCPKCGKNPCECDESCKKESGMMTDSIEEEIDKEKDKPIEESGDGVVDSDVAAVDTSDLSDDDEVIDAAMGNGKKKSGAASKYAYDPSDEDLIAAAMNE